MKFENTQLAHMNHSLCVCAVACRAPKVTFSHSKLLVRDSLCFRPWYLHRWDGKTRGPVYNFSLFHPQVWPAVVISFVQASIPVDVAMLLDRQSSLHPGSASEIPCVHIVAETTGPDGLNSTTGPYSLKLFNLDRLPFVLSGFWTCLPPTRDTGTSSLT